MILIIGIGIIEIAIAFFHYHISYTVLTDTLGIVGIARTAVASLWGIGTMVVPLVFFILYWFKQRIDVVFPVFEKIVRNLVKEDLLLEKNILQGDKEEIPQKKHLLEKLFLALYLIVLLLETFAIGNFFYDNALSVFGMQSWTNYVFPVIAGIGIAAIHQFIVIILAALSSLILQKAFNKFLINSLTEETKSFKPKTNTEDVILK